MQEQLQLGIIERVSDESTHMNNSETHYLPHHSVIRQDNSTTKLCIVYDASAKAAGRSLNDCLFSEPKFNQSILDIILRFRCYRVALVADVEKAFLMVSVTDSDRDMLRFLWVDDVNKASPAIMQMRFTRVVFGVSASPFLLNATIQHHYTAVPPPPLPEFRVKEAPPLSFCGVDFAGPRRAMDQTVAKYG